MAQVRAAVSPGYEGGWLTFECATAKRRLAPVPAEWERLSDSELAGLCARAIAVPMRRRLIE